MSHATEFTTEFICLRHPVSNFVGRILKEASTGSSDLLLQLLLPGAC
jgi:hypothetical protein